MNPPHQSVRSFVPLEYERNIHEEKKRSMNDVNYVCRELRIAECGEILFDSSQFFVFSCLLKKFARYLCWTHDGNYPDIDSSISFLYIQSEFVMDGYGLFFGSKDNEQAKSNETSLHYCRLLCRQLLYSRWK